MVEPFRPIAERFYLDTSGDRLQVKQVMVRWWQCYALFS